MSQRFVHYRKLVRDRHPDQATREGTTAFFRTALGSEYAIRLQAKAREELNEFAASRSVKEFGDFLDCADALAARAGISLEEVARIRHERNAKFGGFEKGVILEKEDWRDPRFMGPVRLGCAGIVTREDRVLLGLSNKAPIAGKWVLPGGGQIEGEVPERTLIRELYEETGVAVYVLGVYGIYSLKNSEGITEREITYFAVEYVAGDICPGSDLDAAEFFSREELKQMCTRGEVTEFVEQVLRDTEWIVSDVSL